jgi:hypothetical protein
VPETLVALVGTGKRVPAILASVTRGLEASDPAVVVVVTGVNTGTDLHVRRECARLGFRFIACFGKSYVEQNGMIVRLASKLIAWPGTPGDTADSRQLSAATWDCVDRFTAKGKHWTVRNSAWAKGERT